MTIKKYQVFQYHSWCVILFLLIFISCEIHNFKNSKIKSEVYIEYKGFEKDEIYESLYKLNFKIINRTKDTIFIDKKKIKLSCRDGKKKLKNEYLDFVKQIGMGQIVVIPKKMSDIEIENEKERKKAKEKFVNKYLIDQKIDESESQLKKVQIMQQLIVILPQESVEYKTIFYNKSFTYDSPTNFDCSCEFN